MCSAHDPGTDVVTELTRRMLREASAGPTLPENDGTVLALDGGNSKTDVVLVSANGEVLSRARSGPFVPHLIGADAAVASLSEAVAAVLESAGLRSADHVAAYLANADLPIEEERIYDAIVSRGWGRTVLVENDTVAMLRAGTAANHGVAVVCGAGINGIGQGPDGRRVRFPALGRTTGDWGGGLGLAKEVLWWTSRAEDGRGSPTALSGAVAAHFGEPTAVLVAQAFHLGTIDHERIYEIVPLLFETAARGDAIATSIVLRQAEEIVLLATVALQRLGLLTVETDLVLGGGILSSGNPVLLDPVRRELAARAPRARIVLQDSVPVLGSALLGLEFLWRSRSETRPHNSAAAIERLRTELVPRTS